MVLKPLEEGEKKRGGEIIGGIGGLESGWRYVVSGWFWVDRWGVVGWVVVGCDW